KRLIEAQGGNVGLESILGVGSTFYALLPLRAEGRSPLPLPRAVSVAPNAPVVLIVEDHERDQELIVRALTSAGYSVETAATGAQAIAKCEERAFAAIA